MLTGTILAWYALQSEFPSEESALSRQTQRSLPAPENKEQIWPQSRLSPSVHTTIEVTFIASIPEISYGLKLFTFSEVFWGRGENVSSPLEQQGGKHRTAEWYQNKSLHSGEASKPGNFHMIFLLCHWCWLVNQSFTSQRKTWFRSLVRN